MATRSSNDVLIISFKHCLQVDFSQSYIILQCFDWKKKSSECGLQKTGFVFAKCIVCESLKDLIPKVGKSNPCVKENEIKI